MATRTDDGDGSGSFAVVETLDRAVYALFARHADRSRHDRDRERYRAADLRVGFDRYLARAYATAWLVGPWVTALVALVALAVPADLLAGAAAVANEGFPLVERLSTPPRADCPIEIQSHYPLRNELLQHRVCNTPVSGRAHQGWKPPLESV